MILYLLPTEEMKLSCINLLVFVTCVTMLIASVQPVQGQGANTVWACVMRCKNNGKRFMLANDCRFPQGSCYNSIALISLDPFAEILKL